MRRNERAQQDQAVGRTAQSREGGTMRRKAAPQRVLNPISQPGHPDKGLLDTCLFSALLPGPTCSGTQQMSFKIHMCPDAWTEQEKR